MSDTLNIDYQNLKLQIAKGQTKQVLEHLHMCFLAQETYKDYFNEVILISSNHKALESARRIDVLNFQKYSTKSAQINKSILELIDDVEAGRSIQKHDQPKIKSFWQIALTLFSMLFFLLTLIVLGIYYFHFNTPNVSPETEEPQAVMTWDCPDFDDSSFHVLVLPFHDVLGEQTAPHKLITDNLDRFCKEENLSAQISRLRHDETVKSLVTEVETKPYTSKCEPDMIVWGSTAINEEGMNITTKYSIVNPFEFTQISNDNRTDIVDAKLHSFGSPKDFDQATEKIQSILKTLLKVFIAFENKDYSTIVKAEKEIQEIPGNQSNMVLAMIEAESHFQLGNKDKAINAYGKALDIDPTEKLALSNRAHLSIEQDELGTALADLTTLIEVSEKPDYEVYQKRAKVNENLNDLGAAKADLLQAKSCSPRPKQKQIEKDIDTIDSKIRDMNNSAKGGKGGRKASTNNLLDEARKENKMGNTTNAATKAKAYLRNNPTSERAVEILVETKSLEQPEITISELKKIPELKNIDEKMLNKFKNPRFKTIIQNEKVLKYRKKKKVDNP